MSPLTICLIICILTVISYVWGRLSLATTAVLSMFLFMVTGCIDANTALSNFGNANGIMMMAMFVVAAGFSKTQFVKNVSSSIANVAKGSLTKIMLGYILIAVLLTQFIQSSVVVFGILAPLLAETVESINVRPSKVMFPLGIACISTVSALPIGAGATQVAELNGYLEANGYTDYLVQLTDPMRARLPLLIVCILYCVFMATRFAPDEPIVAVQAKENRGAESATHRQKLSQFHEIAAFVLFFGTTVALFVQQYIGLAAWQICLAGAVLMVVTGVLKPKEATDALPIWMYLLYVGSLATGSALSNTGAGDLIGDMVARAASGMQSDILIYLMFFAIPFLLTQVMQNRAVMLIFIPIAIQACKSMGTNPVGVIICVQAACLTAFMTPMATPTVAYYMANGGYDLKSVLKQSLIPAVLFCAVSVIWSAIAFPLS